LSVYGVGVGVGVVVAVGGVNFGSVAGMMKHPLCSLQNKMSSISS
jgi:hypothetical protein